MAQLEDVATKHVAIVARGGQPVVLDLDRSAELALVRRGPRGRRTVWAIDRTTGDEQLLVPSGGPGSTDLGRLSPDRRAGPTQSCRVRYEDTLSSRAKPAASRSKNGAAAMRRQIFGWLRCSQPMPKSCSQATTISIVRSQVRK